MHGFLTLDLIQAYPRLFEKMPDEAKRAYPLCNVGWRIIPERLCIRVEAALQEKETFNSFASRGNSVCSGSTGTAISQTIAKPRFSTRSIPRSPARLALATPVARKLGALTFSAGSYGLRRTRLRRSRTGKARLRAYPQTPPRCWRPHMSHALLQGNRHLDRGVAEFARAEGILMA
jgi:hypothetical protein